jgi:zeaxanthin glucosyltransferase
MMTHASHQNSTFQLARTLKTMGHHVIYGGPARGIDGDDLKGNIVRQGFMYSSIEIYSKDGVFSDDIDTQFESFLENLAEESMFQTYINTVGVEIIFLDIHNPLLAIPLSATNALLIFLSTELPTQKSRNVPPLESQFVPSDQLQSGEYVELIWDDYQKDKRLHPLLREYLIGLSDQYGFPFEKLFENRSIVRFGFQLPEVVMWAKEFDFPREDRVNQFFIGNMTDTCRYESSFDKDLFKKDLPIVYCSLGTRAYEDSGKVSFIDRLMQIFGTMHELNFVIGMGGQDIAQSFFENVLVVQNAPQLQILSFARMMITHGGGNSIKECIKFAVPMLCFPHDNDQFGNAARITYHKIGVVPDPSAQDEHIRKHITMLAGESEYRRKIRTMRDRCAQNYHNEDIASIINKLVQEKNTC